MAVVLPPPYPRAPIGEMRDNPIPNQPPQIWLTNPWAKSFRDQRAYLGQLPVSVTPTAVMALDQNDAIATTTIITPDQDGVYAVEYYVAIITADGVSSSAQVVAGWTDQGSAKTKTFTAVTGNTTTTTGSERYLFQADAGAPITYSLTYASNTANAMHYNLYVVLQSVASVQVP